MQLNDVNLRGWLKDPEDIKYTPFDACAPKLTAANPALAAGTDYTVPALPALDQSAEGACVIHAWCGSLEDLLFLENAYAEHLSRNFLYWLCREAMKTTGEDSGTYPWLAGDRIQKVGVCPERVWKYAPGTLFTSPATNQETYTMASDNKALSSYRIDSTGSKKADDIELAVRANHTPIFGSAVDSAILNYQKGQVLDRPTGKIVGGHSMRVRGVKYTPSGRIFVVRNSWGTNYGDQGDLLISEDWVDWDGFNDVWVATRMDPLLL